MSVIDCPITEEITHLDEPEVMDEVDQVLLEAERYMRKHGWTRGAYQNGQGKVCLLGAIIYSNDGSRRARIQAVHRLQKLIDRCYGIAEEIVTFNDRKLKDQEEALSMLRKAREIK